MMVKIVTTIVRGDDTKKVHSYEPRYLDDKMIGQPIPAMYMDANDINRITTSTERFEDFEKSYQEITKEKQNRCLKYHDAIERCRMQS